MRTTLSVVCAAVLLALPASASAVVGGKAVHAGGFPFVVAVGDTEGAYCGGTLIAPNVVATAAHCITGRRTALQRLRVLVGSPAIRVDLATAGGAHVFAVTGVFVHPKFNEKTMNYDAALLMLDRPVAGVRTLALAGSSPLAGSTVSAAGWGVTQEDGATMPNRLRSVVLKIGTTSACSRGNTAQGTYFAPSMLCAGNPGRDTCSGDSGGPLVSSSNGHAVLVGITSFGQGCAESAHPGVYTRVSAIRAWASTQLTSIAAASAQSAPVTP